MSETIRIDFVSDVACPWCVVGLRSLDRALQVLGDDVKADIHFQPFELNPNMPPEGQNTAEHVKEKYGASPERSQATRNVLKESGAALGFDFNYGPDSRIWNTFDAHRLLHWAAAEGKQKQLKEAFFKLTFTDQLPSNDHDALAKAAADVGLDEARAREILNSDEFTAEVRNDQMLWRSRGIQAVPTIILNERWMLQGAQPPEVFEQAIRQVLDGSAEEEDD